MKTLFLVIIVTVHLKIFGVRCREHRKIPDFRIFLLKITSWVKKWPKLSYFMVPDTESDYHDFFFLSVFSMMRWKKKSVMPKEELQLIRRQHIWTTTSKIERRKHRYIIMYKNTCGVYVKHNAKWQYKQHACSVIWLAAI